MKFLGSLQKIYTAMSVIKKSIWILTSQFLFFKINHPFLVISNSKKLIESFNSNYSNSNKNLNFNDIKDKMKYSSKMSNISFLMCKNSIIY